MRALPPPTSVYTVAWVLACMHAHGVRVPWSGSTTYQGVRLPQVEFLVWSHCHWLPLAPASSFPPSSAFFRLVKPQLSKWRWRDTMQRTFWEGLQSGNLVVSNAWLNQQLKVMALETRQGWDIAINLWPLAQWYMCLWVPAWNACDLQLSLCLCMQTHSPLPHSIYRGFIWCFCSSQANTVLFERHTWRHTVKVVEQVLIKWEHVYSVVYQAKVPNVCWFQLIMQGFATLVFISQ